MNALDLGGVKREEKTPREVKPPALPWEHSGMWHKNSHVLGRVWHHVVEQSCPSLSLFSSPHVAGLALAFWIITHCLLAQCSTGKAELCLTDTDE